MVDTPPPPLVPPAGSRGEDIIIIWDHQNVRLPDELEPEDVLRFLYDTFVIAPGPRRCCGCYCTFTDASKRAVGVDRFNQFTSNGVLNVMMVNVPGGPRKADDADHPLKETMMNFTVDCIRAHKDGVILLLTGDADFVRPAVWCKQQGCIKLELLYYEPCTSRDMKSLYTSWKMEWREFLDCATGQRRNWTFPYPFNNVSSAAGRLELQQAQQQQQQQQAVQQQPISGVLRLQDGQLQQDATGGGLLQPRGGIAVGHSYSHHHQHLRHHHLALQHTHHGHHPHLQHQQQQQSQVAVNSSLQPPMAAPAKRRDAQSSEPVQQPPPTPQQQQPAEAPAVAPRDGSAARVPKIGANRKRRSAADAAGGSNSTAAAPQLLRRHVDAAPPAAAAGSGMDGKAASLSDRACTPDQRQPLRPSAVAVHDDGGATTAADSSDDDAFAAWCASGVLPPRAASDAASPKGADTGVVAASGRRLPDHQAPASTAAAGQLTHGAATSAGKPPLRPQDLSHSTNPSASTTNRETGAAAATSSPTVQPPLQQRGAKTAVPPVLGPATALFVPLATAPSCATLPQPSMCLAASGGTLQKQQQRQQQQMSTCAGGSNSTQPSPRAGYSPLPTSVGAQQTPSSGGSSCSRDPGKVGGATKLQRMLAAAHQRAASAAATAAPKPAAVHAAGNDGMVAVAHRGTNAGCSPPALLRPAELRALAAMSLSTDATDTTGSTPAPVVGTDTATELHGRAALCGRFEEVCADYQHRGGGVAGFADGDANRITPRDVNGRIAMPAQLLITAHDAVMREQCQRNAAADGNRYSYGPLPDGDGAATGVAAVAGKSGAAAAGPLAQSADVEPLWYNDWERDDRRVSNCGPAGDGSAMSSGSSMPAPAPDVWLSAAWSAPRAAQPLTWQQQEQLLGGQMPPPQQQQQQQPHASKAQARAARDRLAAIENLRELQRQELQRQQRQVARVMRGSGGANVLHPADLLAATFCANRC